MTKRMSCLAMTLASIIISAAGTSWLALAQLQSSETRSDGGPADETSADEPHSSDDVLSRDSVWHDPEIPALGNPWGNLTLVEYFDYQCPVCKQLHPELSRAIRADGKV